MQVFEVVELQKFPFMGTIEIIQGQIIADVLNENNFDKVNLLVDHDTKRIWKYNGPNSTLKIQEYGDILAGLLRHQLGLFYKIYSLNVYSRDDPEFQELLQKPIRGGRAKPIEKREYLDLKLLEKVSEKILLLHEEAKERDISPPLKSYEVDLEYKLYCKYCGSRLVKGQKICSVCGKMVI